jgi:D-serine deaminase-like pyridoxal phosphate-dependent protein
VTEIAGQDRYAIDGIEGVPSPALVVFLDLVEHNVNRMLEMAGSAERLRPHCKTHKMERIARMQLARGITRHKCATFAEAEMLARAGARDIFLGYNLVGPNMTRARAFLRRYPDVSLLVTADYAPAIVQLGEAVSNSGRTIGVLLDIDPGRGRTGVPVGREAR